MPWNPMRTQNIQTTVFYTLDAFIYIHLINVNIVQKRKRSNCTKQHCVYKRSVQHACSTVSLCHQGSVQRSTLSAREPCNT